MTTAHQPTSHRRRLRQAIDQLQARLATSFPRARFQTVHRPNGEAWLLVTVDADIDAVLDVIIDDLLRLQVDDALPVHVLPLRPLAATPQPLAIQE